MAFDNLFIPNQAKLFSVILILFLSYLVAIMPPLQFWEKATPLFGAFSAVIISGLIISCPTKDK